MTVKDLVIEYLMSSGYNGLYDGDECGCSIDDLNPCAGAAMECQPAYERYCGKCEHSNDCVFKEDAEGSCFRLEKQKP